MSQAAPASLDDEALLELLHTQDDLLGKEAVDEILKRPQLAPRLAAIIDDPDAWADHGDPGWAPVHATYLLAAMRTPGSLDAVLRALQTAVVRDEPYLLDVADALLAAYGPEGIPALLRAYPEAGPYPRIWINDALTHVAHRHPDVIDGVREHLKSVALNDDHPEVRACAAENFLVFAGPADAELLDVLVDRRLLDAEARDDALDGERVSLPPPVPWMRFYDPEAVAERQDEHADLDEDAEPFDPGEILPADPSLSVLSRLDEPGAPPAPLQNAGPKVGRNDPCPCGSGKKFKKCCDA